MAIHNIVFDLGRVLVDFYPFEYLKKMGFSDELAERLLEIIFGEAWKSYDNGDYNDINSFMYKLICENPDLETEIRAVLCSHWEEMHTPIPTSIEYLKFLKEQGYHIYVLSNMGPDSFAYVSSLEFYQYIDGGVFSFQEKVSKPSKQIYQILIKRFDLIPNQTIFLDDRQDNVETAKDIGMHAFLFTEIPTIKAQVEKLLEDLDS